VPGCAHTRSIERSQEGQVKQSDHHDIVVADSPADYVEHPVILDGWSVSCAVVCHTGTAHYSFVPSETARQAEAQNGNIKAEDMIPIVRKRAGPNGESSL
jgi:hypothetical protein